MQDIAASFGLKSEDVRAIGIFGSYLSLCSLLTAFIVWDLFKQYRIRRNGQPSFSIGLQNLVPIGCAITSLGITWYYMLSFFALSYRAWASQHGVELPLRPHDLKDLASFISEIRLGAWLKDVKLFKDAWEVTMETPGRTVWSQPIFFVTAVWAMYLGEQARTRRIRNAWMYMLLGQIVAISFAQSLFFTATTLYEPDDKPASREKEKDDDSKSAASLYLFAQKAIVAVSLLPALTISGTTNTPSFLWTLAVPHLALMLPPIIGPLLSNHISRPGDNALIRSDLYRTARFVVVFAFLWEVKTAVRASTNTSTDRHIHRHSAVYMHPLLRSTVSNATTTGWQDVLFSLYDHPAVSSVGWDSILCLLNYQMWRLSQSE